MSITRRSLLQSLFLVLAARRAGAAAVVSTLVGTGTAGFSDQQVNNPYGAIFGRDGGLYFAISTISAFVASIFAPAA